MTDSKDELDATDLHQRAEQLLAGKGYILMSDSVGDTAARRLWNARFDEFAANPPTEAELRGWIDTFLAYPRPYPLWGPASIDPEPSPVFPGADPRGLSLAWIRPQDLILDEGSEFPYHDTPGGLAKLCVQTAQDRVQAEHLATGKGTWSEPWVGNGLIVKQVHRPGGSAFWVTTNGNHRALSFQALGLPLVPAWLEPHGNWWEIDHEAEHRRPLFMPGWPPVDDWRFEWHVHPSLLELLQADGLITEHQQEDPPWGRLVFHSEHAVPWFLHPNPSLVPSLLAAYEAKFGRLEDQRYDWLRTTTRMRRRLWAHAWPEISGRLRESVRRVRPAAAEIALQLVVGAVLTVAVWLLFHWWTGD